MGPLVDQVRLVDKNEIIIDALGAVLLWGKDVHVLDNGVGGNDLLFANHLHSVDGFVLEFLTYDSGGEEGKRRSKWDQMAPDSAKTISAFGPLKK